MQSGDRFLLFGGCYPGLGRQAVCRTGGPWKRNFID